MGIMMQEVEGDVGYSTRLRLAEEELGLLRRMVHLQWLARIGEHHPDLIEIFKRIEINDYHLHSELIEHSKIWTKKNRILSNGDVYAIRQMAFMKTLAEEFGEFQISNEEGLEKEEIYWRLVRPQNQADVGPLHADSMFWDLGHGCYSDGFKRIKVWIALYCESGKSGFRYAPGSHKHKIEYIEERRGGVLKPKINDLMLKTLQINTFETEPGGIIIFNDDLIHGGLLGGKKTRLSMEFTMFVKCDSK